MCPSLVSFRFLPPFGFDAIEQNLEVTLYYSAFTTIFMISWATIEMSHLAMIPELASTEDDRASLSIIRASMVAFANILTYSIASVVFKYGKSKSIVYLIFRNIHAVDLTISRLTFYTLYLHLTFN